MDQACFKTVEIMWSPHSQLFIVAHISFCPPLSSVSLILTRTQTKPTSNPPNEEQSGKEAETPRMKTKPEAMASEASASIVHTRILLSST